MDDLFCSIIEHCLHSSSQESLLNRSEFAREGELFPTVEHSGRPDAATGITVVSPPETPRHHTDDDAPLVEDYRIPPEENCLSISPEQPRPFTEADSRGGRKFDDCIDGISRRGCGVAFIDADFKVTKCSVDLGFAEEWRNEIIEAVYDGTERVRELSEIEFKKFDVGERRISSKKSSIEPPLKKPKTSDENLGMESPKAPVEELQDNFKVGTVSPLNCGPPETIQDTEELIIESENDNEEATDHEMDAVNSTRKKLDFRDEINGNDKHSEISGGTEDIDSNDEDEGQGMISGEISTADQVKGNGGGGDKADVIESRELPFSTTEAAQKVNANGKSETIDIMSNEKMPDEDARFKDNGEMVNLLEALRVLSKEMPCNHAIVDIFKTAKNRGMKFPQPRWLAHKDKG
ncbi:hypothetical protein Nepgr_024469 [Nepenthes gracilis]|uniref:Uncharacterized protein n=1 Tax=Nepenthes gracilis TaxID=150966 RepID=A0AAD3T617_NEPGR|nr:hypothetical protein Nepgr_024469 [Nepenthes gracilis]